MLSESPKEFIDNSSVGVHAVSAEGIILYANQWELDTLGYTKEEYVGHHVSEFQIDEVCLKDMMSRLENNEILHNYPARVQGKHEVVYIIYNSSIYSEGDKFIHTRCFGNEVEIAVYEVFLNIFQRDHGIAPEKYIKVKQNS